MKENTFKNSIFRRCYYTVRNFFKFHIPHIYHELKNITKYWNLTSWAQRMENRKLLKKYPWLRLHNVWSGYRTNYLWGRTWLDDMPNGWRKAFGLQMCEEIDQELRKNPRARKKYFIEQIKEKYGSLCWYTGPAPSEVHNIVSKYEDLSEETCIKCGKPATHMTKGWIMPLCDECDKEK